MAQRWIIGSLVALVAALAGMSRAATGETTCSRPSEAEIAGLFERWNASLATLHPDRVLRNYSDAAHLFPLAAQSARSGEAEIRDYYVYFLQRQPRAVVSERTIRADCNLASDAGVYALTVKSRLGKGTETLRVRYSFFYERRGSDWRIVHEHASLGPEKGLADRVALVNVDPLATDTAPPKAVAGYVKRASARRRPAAEPTWATPTTADRSWRASVPENEAR